MTKILNKAFLASAQHNCYSLAKFLLENTDTNISDSLINKALVGAIRHCSTKFIQLLIDYGADIHTNEKFLFQCDGDTSEHEFDMNEATRISLGTHDRINKIQYLLEAGIKFSSGNIWQCIYHGKINMFRLLINYVDLPPKKNIRNALITSCISADQKKIFVEELIKVDPTYEEDATIKRTIICRKTSNIII